MKIAYCLDWITFMGGIERITIAKANALAKIKGNEVYLILAYHKKEPIYPLNPQIKLVVLDVNYGADLGSSSFQAYKIMLQKRKEHKQKLEKAIQEIHPDILISVNHSEKFFIKSLNLTYRPVIIRELHFCTEYRSMESKNVLQKWIAQIRQFWDFKWKMDAIDRIVLLTEEDQERHWKHNPKAVVIPNPLTVGNHLGPASLTEKKVMAVGRLVIQKNFSSLIQAWSQVACLYPDWTLEIYGEGGLKNELIRQIHDLKLEKNVYLKGVSHEIPAKMSSSSLFVLSSIYEGFGLVLIEAMSCGLPVVSYACPCGPKDIIDEGKDGFLVPVNDEQTLADRIIRLIEDEELRRQMSKAALQKSEKYRMDKIIPMWMNLFEELLQEKRAKG